MTKKQEFNGLAGYKHYTWEDLSKAWIAYATRLHQRKKYYIPYINPFTDYAIGEISEKKKP